MLHQLRVYLLEDNVVIPKHATLIHKEAHHADAGLHKLILVFVVFVVVARYLVAQIALDTSLSSTSPTVFFHAPGSLPSTILSVNGKTMRL
jgi:hypothetical protein